MISAVLFGRNDNHHGDFRKRAVLSINALAEQLGYSDEIIFVDWNTASGIAPLPQAISPFLTPKARSLLRIHLVDESIHRQWAKRGATLPVVPVVAYNAAIRRSNPNHKWILITTLDALVVSRIPGRTLAQIAGALEDAVYELPRYELPTWIWQALPATGQSLIASQLQEWGRQLHLEEAIRLPQPELFDSPGDFQLVLRRDLFAIDGLDEGMVIGITGPDSNLLMRLQLLGRPTRSLDAQLINYHCDHTAIRTIGDTAPPRIQNDINLFFHEVAKAECVYQRPSWGLAATQLPTATLDEGGAGATTVTPSLKPDPQALSVLIERLACIAQILQPAQSASYDTNPVYNAACYPSKHVFPHLLSHIFETTGPIVYVGRNDLLMSLLKDVLRQLQPHRTLSVLIADASHDIRFAIESASWNKPSERLTVIFDFGVDASRLPGVLTIEECDDDLRAALYHVKTAFQSCISDLQGAAMTGSRSPQVVTLNSINTEFEALVLDSLDCNLSPYITRIRSGMVAPSPRRIPVVAHAAADHMATVLGRTQGIHVREFARSWGIASRLARQSPDEPVPRQWRSASVRALLQWPEIASALAVPEQRVQRAAKILDQLGRKPASQSTSALVGKPALSKLASVKDWEHPDWYRLAYWYLSDNSSYNVYQRGRRDWECVHFLYGLAQLDVLDSTSEVAVVASRPDLFTARLANRAQKVRVINVGRRPNNDFLRVPALSPPGRVVVYAGFDDDRLSDVRCAAVILIRQSGYKLSSIDLASLQHILEPNGYVGMAFDAGIDTSRGSDWLRRMRRSMPSVDELRNGELVFWSTLPRTFSRQEPEDWNVDLESLQLFSQGADRVGRGMTVERFGLRRTSAIRWLKGPN